MRHQLSRLLRIRRMLENLSRLKLERRTADLRLLEQRAEQQRCLAVAARSDALEQLEAGSAELAPDWLTAITDAEILRWNRSRLAVRAATRRAAVEAARAELLTQRIERRQAEGLLSAAAAVREKEQRRREQDQVDDWFQSRAMRSRFPAD
jgi:hypothetical protein